MTRSRAVLMLAFAMTLFLSAIVISHEHARRTGTELILRMKPVDPRSLFRGHYVRIHTILQDMISLPVTSGEQTFFAGDRVYLTLTGNDKDGWKPSGAYHHRPANGMFIQGRIIRAVYWNTDTKQVDDAGQEMRLNIHWGVSSYFASEHQAKEMETKQQSGQHKMRLILSIGKDGKPVIKGMEIDGERFVDGL